VLSNFRLPCEFRVSLDLRLVGGFNVVSNFQLSCEFRVSCELRLAGWFDVLSKFRLPRDLGLAGELNVLSNFRVSCEFRVACELRLAGWFCVLSKFRLPRDLGLLCNDGRLYQIRLLFVVLLVKGDNEVVISDRWDYAVLTLMLRVVCPCSRCEKKHSRTRERKGYIFGE